MIKPWYIFRPTQIGKRLRRCAPGYQTLPLAWGAQIIADPSKTIGRAIANTGVYDLAVSEALVRLLRAGDLAVDAGANLGYMAKLMATVIGPSGRVLAFEPHPEMFKMLTRNTSELPVQCQELALGEVSGWAQLECPTEFANNEGVARISSDGPGVRVLMGTLDEAIGEQAVALLKLDVEGYELQALQGAQRALSERRITHIVFEDHQGDGSQVMDYLASLQFSIFSIGWSFFGPRLAPASTCLTRRYEPPSYLATLQPARAREAMAPRGFRVLSNLSAS